MKKRNLLMSATIMCGLLAVAFTFKINQVTWLWADSKPVGSILGISAVILGIQWFRQQRLLNKEGKSS
jgi:hypothetical protein